MPQNATFGGQAAGGGDEGRKEFYCINAIVVAVTILLAMTVYQVIISEKLPSSFSSVPVIGQ